LQISFVDKKLENVCQDQRLLIKTHGQIRAKKINQRLASLKAAETLADIRNFPGRCHELKGDRAGQLALDLDHPYRLIFVPDHNPTPRKTDGGLDWQAVTAVCLLDVEDYHD
jgi:toxin HigB-1